MGSASLRRAAIAFLSLSGVAALGCGSILGIDKGISEDGSGDSGAMEGGDSGGDSGSPPQDSGHEATSGDTGIAGDSGGGGDAGCVAGAVQCNGAAPQFC